MIWIFFFAVFIVLKLVANHLRRQKIDAAIAAGATPLAPCSATVTQALAWLPYPKASIYVMDGALVMLTFNGILRVLRKGLSSEPIPNWPRNNFDSFADEVVVTQGVMTIRFSGFASGTLKLKELPSDDQQRVVNALKVRPSP